MPRGVYQITGAASGRMQWPALESVRVGVHCCCWPTEMTNCPSQMLSPAALSPSGHQQAFARCARPDTKVCCARCGHTAALLPYLP